jgi:hypothetical protein
MSENPAVNPAHYKDFMFITDTEGNHTDSLQWLEHTQMKPYYRENPKAFVQAVLLQSDKYISRLGKKDDETQEMEKALWYLKFATAFMKNGCKPIRVNDVDKILSGEKVITGEYFLLLKYPDRTDYELCSNGIAMSYETVSDVKEQLAKEYPALTYVIAHLKEF